jgi:hypothetical protein
MDAGNDFRVNSVVFQADTRFARGHQEIGEGDGHTIWDSARQNCSYPFKRVHIVASEKWRRRRSSPRGDGQVQLPGIPSSSSSMLFLFSRFTVVSRRWWKARRSDPHPSIEKDYSFEYPAVRI